MSEAAGQGLELVNAGHLFDHPEAVAWGPDGLAYAGGEAGQLYRWNLAGGPLEVVARVEGGFLLGLALDADANVYACDERLGRVHRITPAGEVATYAEGRPDRPMRLPNYPVFDDAGTLYVSDSGTWGARDGCIWRVPPTGASGGAAEVWDESASGFPNGMCLAADGRSLIVAESSPPLVSRVEIGEDGRPGARTVLVELPRQVPDGVALDVEGGLIVSLYNPNMIHRLTPDGRLVTLADDWEQLRLVAPTNVAFAGEGLRTLLIASLCGWSVHAARMEVPGLPLRYPRLPAPAGGPGA